MICSFGGYPTIRHNELRDIIGSLLSEVCHNVAIEPRLQPLTGEVFRSKTTTSAPEARADVRATGFWTKREDAFFDIRIFHANAPSYRSLSPTQAFEFHERHKQLEYEERIVNVDHGSFCPLVFSTSGAVGPLCGTFLKRLAGLVADQSSIAYSEAMAWLRCRFSYALLRSAVMYIFGTHDHHTASLSETSTLTFRCRWPRVASLKIEDSIYRLLSLLISILVFVLMVSLSCIFCNSNSSCPQI